MRKYKAGTVVRKYKAEFVTVFFFVAWLGLAALIIKEQEEHDRTLIKECVADGNARYFCEVLINGR